MDCLKGYIGLRTVSASNSGLWVNDLPLISTDMVANLTSLEATEAAAVWDKVESWAALTLSEELYALLRAEYACLPESKANSEETYLSTIESHICGNRHLVKMPLWYLLGVGVINEALHTKNANKYSLVNIDRTRDLQTEFYAKYEMYLEKVLGQVQLCNLFTGPKQNTGYSYGYRI